jgi:hypothetical protein
MQSTEHPYYLAQVAMAQLKASVHMVLSKNSNGLKNSEIGRELGIYMGHVEHEGHIPRTLLAIMEAEGVVEQDKKTKIWRLSPTSRKDDTE